MPPITYFSDDVAQYMELNGFVRVNTRGLHNGMLWQREENLAVYFWQNRVEVHVKNAIGDWHVKNTYTGFDGHNMQHLIMMLHCMEAITIDSANKLAVEQEAGSTHIGKIMMSMPVYGQTRENANSVHY